MQHSLSADPGAGTKARVTLESYSENCLWPCAQLRFDDSSSLNDCFKVSIAADDAFENAIASI